MNRRVAVAGLGALLLVVAVGLFCQLRRDTGSRPKDGGSPPTSSPFQVDRGEEMTRSDPRKSQPSPAQKEWQPEPRQQRKILNAGLLSELAANPHKDHRRLAEQIFLAAAEKDADFRSLLDRQDLREVDPEVSIALDVYDYTINGNRAALDKILALNETEGKGGSLTRWALSYVDEWHLTLQAVASQPTGDSDAGYAFWETRASQFPEHYRKFMRDTDQNLSSMEPDLSKLK